MFGLYIHLPFCASKCAYCDFASFSGHDDNFIDSYLCALLREAALQPAHAPVDTLYIGGGTPSLLTENQMDFLFSGLAKRYGNIANLREATIEANPESLTENKLKIMRSHGFNRLSLGMQSTSNEHLKLIGRAHNYAQFLQAFKTAKKYFDNINIDIIAGLPKQTLQDFTAGLRRVITLGPQHISVYGLQVEEGTPLFKRGFITDDNLTRQMLQAAYDILQNSGFGQYEISNFALRGRESLHNLNYWDGGDYLGLGSSAASFLKGARSQNISEPQKYINLINSGQSATAFTEKLTGKAALGERVMIALRKNAGAPLTDEVLANFGPSIEQLKSQVLQKTMSNLTASIACCGEPEEGSSEYKGLLKLAHAAGVALGKS